ncbi:DUF6531 domain-containing protein [Streptomyces sp. NPDC059373]
MNRTYNSLDPRTTNAFGAGWSTRWDMRLRNELDNGTVLITMADGSQARFGTNADGSYAPPSGFSGTLKHEYEGWVLRDATSTTPHGLASREGTVLKMGLARSRW